MAVHLIWNEAPKDVSVAAEILVVMLGWMGTEGILSRRTGWCPAGMAHRSRITTKIFTTISFGLKKSVKDKCRN